MSAPGLNPLQVLEEAEIRVCDSAVSGTAAELRGPGTKAAAAGLCGHGGGDDVR